MAAPPYQGTATMGRPSSGQVEGHSLGAHTDMLTATAHSPQLPCHLSLPLDSGPEVPKHFFQQVTAHPGHSTA